MEAVLIREARAGDLKAINDIYNHYVLHSTCTYQTEPSSFEERQKWFEEHKPPYAVTVVEMDGKVVGWGSISRFHPRAAYGKTVENSVYLHTDWLGKGIGKTLLKDLIERTKKAGFHTIVAIISADQTPSVKLHQSLGFAQVGDFKQVGNKFGRWLDVVYWQLIL